MRRAADASSRRNRLASTSNVTKAGVEASITAAYCASSSGANRAWATAHVRRGATISFTADTARISRRGVRSRQGMVMPSTNRMVGMVACPMKFVAVMIG